MIKLKKISMVVKNKGSKNSDAWKEVFDPNTFYSNPELLIDDSAEFIAQDVIDGFNNSGYEDFRVDR